MPESAKDNRTLIITEKAIAGARIAQILAGKTVPAERTGAAQLFSFSKDGKEFILIPLRGHIADVDFPREFVSWLGTDLKQLVFAPVQYVATEEEIVNLLRKYAPLASCVIIATDADREGEAIGVEALRFLQETNPSIAHQRAYYSAITPKDISTAFSELSKVDFDFADSANARREIDLIWGAVLTRFVSIASRKMGKEFLSVGRVQTPVLALIVAREKERLAFSQQKYWVLSAVFEKDLQSFEAEHKTGKFWDKAQAEAVLSKRVNTGIVVSVLEKQRVLEKPIPFNTTGFLRAASALGLSAGDAMSLAESLYQLGLTSYPRTDNTVYPKNLDLEEILKEIEKVPVFALLVRDIRALGPLKPSAGKETKDHPPVHPVAAASKEKLSAKQWAVYELIVRRFLATLADEAVTHNLRVEIDLNSEPFIASGQTIVKKGWKAYYPYSVLKEVILPSLSKGDVVKLLDLQMLEKETQPPPRFSQSALIKLMDELGLGTKSTRHEVLNKLYSRHYISGIQSIVPSQVAFALIDALEKYCKTVTEPAMTVQLELEMDAIVSGKKKKDEVVEVSRNLLSGILTQLLEKRSDVGFEIKKALLADSTAGKCTRPNCGGDLLVRHGKTGKRFLGCSTYPRCSQTYPLPQKGKVQFLGTSCKVCGAPQIKLLMLRRALELCVNMNCATKDEWKKRQAEKKEALDAKAGLEKNLSGKTSVFEDSTGNKPKPVVKKRSAKTQKQSANPESE